MYDITDLLKKRLELKISLREVQKHTGLNASTLSKIERGKKTLSKQQILALEQFYDDCEAGRINYQQKDNVCSTVYNSVRRRKQRQKKQEVSSQKISDMRKIREKLNLTLKDVGAVIELSRYAASERELGIVPLSKNEYKKIMDFFKQEKLKRIFGEKK